MSREAAVPETPAALHILVRGRVQGVWFRASTQAEALRRSLTGWVRNLQDGRVEAWAEGDKAELRLWLDWCRQGPELASVTELTMRWTEPRGLSDFVILEDACASGAEEIQRRP